MLRLVTTFLVFCFFIILVSLAPILSHLHVAPDLMNSFNILSVFEIVCCKINDLFKVTYATHKYHKLLHTVLVCYRISKYINFQTNKIP